MGLQALPHVLCVEFTPSRGAERQYSAEHDHVFAEEAKMNSQVGEEGQ